MVFIRDLTEEDRQRVINALDADGFTNIEVKEDGAYIAFSKSPRNFELYSINLKGEINNQVGLDIYLDENLFFAGSLKSEESRQVNFANQEKVRHSTSLSQKDESDIAIAVESIGWELENQYNFEEDMCVSRPEVSTEMLHLVIKGKDYFALNHGSNNNYCVYEGSPEIMLSLISEPLDNFFEAPTLKRTLMEINEEHRNS